MKKFGYVILVCFVTFGAVSAMAIPNDWIINPDGSGKPAPAPQPNPQPSPKPTIH